MNFRIAPSAVRAQLRRILASDVFVRCPRMQRFLEFIVEETLAGRADQLGEYAIGISVFDRGPEFEPGLNPIVRNDARRLRVKLLEYYRQAQNRTADELIIDVPKGGYAPVFAPMPSPAESPAVRDDLPRRIAVLPFEALSGAPQDAMYGRALCMSLTTGLTGLEGLESIAYGYVRDRSIVEAASELRLTHAIHGSVLQASDRYRVTVHLIRVHDGTQLWAREYEFQDTESAAYHSEITRTVRREVAARLGRSSGPARLAMAA